MEAQELIKLLSDVKTALPAQEHKSSDRKLLHLSYVLLTVFIAILGLQTMQLRSLMSRPAQGATVAQTTASSGNAAAGLLQGLQSQVGGCGG